MNASAGNVPMGYSLHFTEAAALLAGTHHGGDGLFGAVSTDTRTLVPGALFVALIGPNFDGHDYVATARERGACAALVSRPVDDPLPQIRVADTRLALGELAAWWRTRADLPVVAVTGSSGKTTVKEMIAAILARRGPVLATQGNLNNDIGVPLTLLRLRPEHRYAVVELGANHPGEISYTTTIARPDVALVTNAGPAHLEGFGSLEGVARAKGEIYAGLAENGTGVVNAEDPFAAYWTGLLAGRRCLTFGLGDRAEVRALPLADDADGQRFRLESPWGATEGRLALPGRHNLLNGAAAAAAALAVGAAPEEVVAGLAGMAFIRGRLQVQPGRGGCRLIDDSYNANPGSVRAAIDVLAGCGGERVLVLGDMAELGPEAPALHADIGRAAQAAGLERLYTLGPLCREAAAAFGPGAEQFDSHAALAAALEQVVHPEMTVLVKGSRSMRMERVVDALRAPVED